MDVEHFCGFIWKLREDAKISRPDLESKYPWHRNTIRSYEKDNRLPDIDYLYALAIETGFDFKELLKLRLKVGLLNLDEEEIDSVFNSENIDFCQSEIKTNFGTKTIQMNDDSMNPTISKLAMIRVDEDDKTLAPGMVFAIVLNDLVTARRVQFGMNNEVMFLADNAIYMPLKVDKTEVSKLNIIGKVLTTTNPL